MHTLGSLVLALQVQDGAAPLPGAAMSSTHRARPDPSIRRSSPSWSCSRSPPGRSSFRRSWSYPQRRAPDDAVPRRLPPQQQVLRSAGRLPVAARQPARRRVPGRLRRAERAVPRAPARRPRPIQARPPARPMLKSLDGGRSRAAPRGDHRGEQAREAADVPRDDRQRHAVHRPVRHGVGHHDRVPAHRRHRLDQPGGRRRRASRGADRDRGRAVRGDPGGVLLQPLHAPGEGASRRRWTTSRSSS